MELLNLVRQETTPAQQDYWKQIIRYGECDNFPLRLARLVQNSPTASSCIDTKIDFLAGAQFSDPTLADKIINGRKERFGDIHLTNCEAYGTFEGLALNIKWSRNQKISEIYSIPFEYCRLVKTDSKGVVAKIKVNPYFGTDEYRLEFTKEYDVYNPDKKAIIEQQTRDGKAYKGQILYVATTGPLSRFYPAPKYYSANYWMAIDEAIGGFHKHNIDNGFFQSVILRMIGDHTIPSTHPDDMTWNSTTNQYDPNPKITRGQRFNIEMQKFSGWNKAGNALVEWGLTKEEWPDIVAFPSTTNSELFKTIQDICTEQIARATKVPSVLANIQSGASLGGDGNAIRASVKLMQQRVVRTHGMLERVYKDLLTRMEEPYTGEVKILHYNPFPELEKIDPLIWAAIPLPDQQAWIVKNTDFTITQTAPVVAPVSRETQVLPAENKFLDVFYADYPEKAKQTAQKAKDFRDKTGSACGGKAGWMTCEDIIAGRPLGFKTIKRIYNWLNKKRDFASHIFSDSCESVLFSSWGGVEMMNWAENKIKSINE